MGVDTHAFLPHTTLEDLVSVLNALSDSGATIHDTHEENYKTIRFYYRGEERDLSVFKMIIDVTKAKEVNDYLSKNKNAKYTQEMMIYSDSESHVREGLPNKTPGLYTSFRLWGHAVEIAQVLAAIFKGYVDDNDCDADYYYKMTLKKRKELVKSILS